MTTIAIEDTIFAVSHNNSKQFTYQYIRSYLGNISSVCDFLDSYMASIVTLE